MSSDHTVETDAAGVGDALASDHRPVVAELSVPGSVVGKRSCA